MDKNNVIIGENAPRIVLSEDTLAKGYLEIDDARALLIQSITAYCEILGMKKKGTVLADPE